MKLLLLDKTLCKEQQEWKFMNFDHGDHNINRRFGKDGKSWTICFVFGEVFKKLASGITCIRVYRAASHSDICEGSINAQKYMQGFKYLCSHSDLVLKAFPDHLGWIISSHFLEASPQQGSLEQLPSSVS